MSRRPRILDELGQELTRAAKADEARRPAWLSRGPFARLSRAMTITLLALFGVAAAATAATLIIGRGGPIPPAPAGDVPVELRPVEGSARLNGLNVRDPDGGPAWDVRTSRSTTGAVCATVGQVLDGELGLVGLDRRFRALPAGAADTCSVPRSRGATLAGARAFRGGGRFRAVTVVNGVAAPSVRSAIAVAGGRVVPMRLGPDRAFLAVFPGQPEEIRPRVVLRDAAGHRTSIRFADEGQFIAPDPDGGVAWELKQGRLPAGLRCVSAQRAPGTEEPVGLEGRGFVPFSSAPSVPIRCGARGAAFVGIRRFVPRYQRSGSYWWGFHPARTVVWGGVPSRDARVVLRGAGAPRRLRVDPATQGFLLVLDGRVDPRRLTLLVDGRRTDPRNARGTRGQRLAEAKVPGWRSVREAVHRSSASSGAPVTLPGSRSIVARAEDPTGGPGWVLQARSSRASGTSVPPQDLRCYEVGIDADGVLLAPVAGGGTRRVTDRGWQSYCAIIRDGRTASTFGPEVRTYVDDPSLVNPRPQRVVVSGVAGPSARSAELLGAGPPRPLELGPDGEYLAVLAAEAAGAELTVRVRDRRGRTSTQEGSSRLECEPVPGRAVRVADPGGGPSWVASLGRTTRSIRRLPRGSRCEQVARLVGERPVLLLDGETYVVSAQPGFTSRGRVRPTPGSPLRLSIFPHTEIRLGGAPVAPTPAQIARRTLPGRTVISGVAHGDVIDVTLRTPRDVRTVRPGPGGLILAVYDGEFHGGVTSATARMRDGRTVTRQLVRPGPPPF